MKIKLLPLLVLVPFLGMAQWSITTLGANHKISFDKSVAGVNGGQFVGLGATNVQSNGLLNSNAWAMGSNGNSFVYGASSVANYFKRGNSNNSVGTVGVYAFNTAGPLSGTDYCLGFKGNSLTGDFNTGLVTIKLTNNTGSTINVLRLGYEAKELNSTNEDTELEVSYSFDNFFYTPFASGFNHETEQALDASPTWTTSNKGTLLTGLTWANGADLYIQWVVSQGSAGDNSGLMDEIGIDDIIVRPYASDYIFNGTAWDVDPSGVNDPTASALVLPGASTAQLTASTILGVLNVENNGSINIQSDLTVVDSAFFNAGAAGYSSVHGEIIGKTCYQIYLNSEGGRWFNLGIPVDTTLAAIKGIKVNAHGVSNSTNIYRYDASQNVGGEGVFVPANALTEDTEKIGYQIWGGDGTYFGDAPYTLTICGDLMDGTITIPVSGGNTGGYNIIPNVYASPMSWLAFTNNAENVDMAKVFYIQDGQDVGTTYKEYHTVSGSGPSGGQNLIAPGQSFFVRVNPGTTNGLLDFENSNRTFDNNVPAFKTQTTVDFISVLVSDNTETYKDEVVLMFDGAYSDNAGDREDAGQMPRTGAFPNVYTIHNGENISYNAFNDQFSVKSVDVGFDAAESGVYTFDIFKDEIPTAWTVILQDKLTGDLTNLRKTTYSFSHVTGAAANRFALHINKTGAVSVNEVETRNVYAYTDNANLMVNLADLQKAEVMVVDVTGKVVFEKTDVNNLVKVDMTNWSKGVYFVKVLANGAAILNQKVIND